MAPILREREVSKIVAHSNDMLTLGKERMDFLETVFGRGIKLVRKDIKKN